jgi:hypothetical protein
MDVKYNMKMNHNRKLRYHVIKTKSKQSRTRHGGACGGEEI